MALQSYHPNDYETFIGLDVDKNNFSYTVSDKSQTEKSKKMPSNPEHLYNYIEKHYDTKKVICAYEAGPTGFHLYDYLTEKNIRCLITAPSSIPVARNQKVKNNRIDSIKITNHLMTGKLKPIRVPEGCYRELRNLVKLYENYAKDRKRAKQRIKSFLLYSNLQVENKEEEPERNWSSKYIKKLREIECSYSERQRLNMSIEDLEEAQKKILTVLRTLRKFCRENEGINENIKYLRSIPGIGFIIAVMLLGKIGDPEDLDNPRELASFIGLNPREKSTGDTTKRGSITHMGNKTLRFYMVEAAWVAIRRDHQLKQFYHRIKSRHHPKIASRVAITAVARKMTQIVYRVLKDKRDYIQY